MPDLRTRRQAPELSADGRYWIAETAVVIGRVRLMQDASIWFGSVLRGDNEWIEVASAPTSRKAARCTPTWVPDGDRRRLHHRAQCGAAWLHHRAGKPDRHGGDRAQRAKIGANCWSRRALVTEGKEFPDNSLIVGSPRARDQDARGQGRAVGVVRAAWVCEALEPVCQGTEKIG